jgi:hypothetical protein
LRTRSGKHRGDLLLDGGDRIAVGCVQHTIDQECSVVGRRVDDAQSAGRRADAPRGQAVPHLKECRLGPGFQEEAKGWHGRGGGADRLGYGAGSRKGGLNGGQGVGGGQCSRYFDGGRGWHLGQG